MGHTRRRKRHTHQEAAPSHETGEKIPKSFVFARGKLPLLLRTLEQDLRKLMMPHTAVKLRESEKNTMKDFVHVAGPLGVSHFLIMSNTKTSPYLRVARSPHGPTLTFKIHDYTLSTDVARCDAKYRAPPAVFKTPPLVVLNGFNSSEAHLKLITIMFQNIFPVIDVKTVKLANCQRVLLLNYDKETKMIDFRHYSITAQPVGVSRGIRKLVQRTKLPDLRALDDVSDYITKSGYGSESEAENESSRVVLPQQYGRGNPATQQSAVKLHEIGPRMSLQLVKVEEGLCSGAVMFHEYVKKTSEEIATLKETIQKRESLRKQRRAEQEANVRRKQLIKEQKQKKKQKGMDADGDAKEDEHEDDDAEWFRQEVGEEPGEDFMTGAARKTPNTRPPRGFKVGKSKFSAQVLKKHHSMKQRKMKGNAEQSKKRSHGDANGASRKRARFQK